MYKKITNFIVYTVRSTRSKAKFYNKAVKPTTNQQIVSVTNRPLSKSYFPLFTYVK